MPPFGRQGQEEDVSMNIRHAHVDLDEHDVVFMGDGTCQLAQDSAQRALAELGASISKATVILWMESGLRKDSFSWSGGEEITIILEEDIVLEDETA